MASLPERRPAETGGVAGGAALLLARAFGVTDPDVIIALGVVVGFIPAAITWTVETLRKPSDLPPSPPT